MHQAVCLTTVVASILRLLILVQCKHVTRMTSRFMILYTGHVVKTTMCRGEQQMRRESWLATSDVINGYMRYTMAEKYDERVGWIPYAWSCIEKA